MIDAHSAPHPSSNHPAHGQQSHPSYGTSPATNPAEATAIPVLPPANPVLTAQGLRRAYGSTLALDGVDLQIHAGESVAIMGPSGSGKSTLLHTLAGIEKPDAGSVLLSSPEGSQQDIATLGQGARSKLRREAFGFVFQSGLLIPELTAVENVAMALMINGVSRAAALPRSAQWLAALGLAGMEERRIGQLSGGQAQRVAIARAQVTGARVIFADEPTGALDSATSADVLAVLMESTVGRGNTLVMVTHDAEVASRCDRIISLRDGRIISHAYPAAATSTVPTSGTNIPGATN